MTKVKICGMRSLDDIEAANQLKPDYIGFVFAKSKRQISKEQAKLLKKALSPDIKAVGVFVNEDMDWILSLCEEHIIDLIQLHGDEDFTYIEKLHSKTTVPIIRAIRVQTKEQVEKARELPVEYLLCDTYSKDSYGGCGETFSYELLPEDLENYFLAGGLHSENVAKAIQKTHPYCVDVSSGVETDGKKDIAKMKAFIHAVRGI